MANKKRYQQRPGVRKTDGLVQASGIQIQNISIRPVDRTNLDIQKWRNAHMDAESLNGRRVSLYDLYDDVLLDGFLRRMVARRIGGVVRNKLQYTNSQGQPIPAAEGLLKSLAFRRLRQAIQRQKAWGITVAELGNLNGQLHVFEVPRKHIRPAEGLIITEQHDYSGIAYREPPYNSTVLEVGEFGDLGYLLPAAAYVIYKRGGVADWANFAQIFGMPFREARYDGFNENVRIQLEQALEKAGSAAYAVLPKEAELTFHEAKNTANSTELFNELRRAMNEEIMVLVLGSTESTTSSKSSGYAQSETHAKTVDEVLADDREEELAIMNEQVLPILLHLGLLPAGGSFRYDDVIDLEEAKKQVDLAIKLKNAGVPVADDYLYQITGIPKPPDYEAQKAQQAAEKAAEAGSAAPPPKARQGSKMAHSDELRQLMEKMDRFFGEAL